MPGSWEGRAAGHLPPLSFLSVDVDIFRFLYFVLFFVLYDIRIPADAHGLVLIWFIGYKMEVYHSPPFSGVGSDVSKISFKSITKRPQMGGGGVICHISQLSPIKWLLIRLI
jgi:hypothetical protein